MEEWTEETSNDGWEDTGEGTVQDAPSDSGQDGVQESVQDAREDAPEDNVQDSTGGIPEDTGEDVEGSTEESTEESAEGSTGESTEGSAGENAGEEATDTPVDVGELVEILKGYTDAESGTDAGGGEEPTFPEEPAAVTDEATLEALAKIQSTLDGMSVSMNSIYTDTAAYQEESLSYMQKSDTWLSGIFIALLIVGLASAINAGLKLADILFGRMRT